MNNNDFIREVKNLIDRFVAEWITINSEYEKSIGKDLQAMLDEEINKTKAQRILDEIDLKLNGVVG